MSSMPWKRRFSSGSVKDIPYENEVEAEKKEEFFDNVLKFRITKKYIGVYDNVPGKFALEFDRNGKLLSVVDFTAADKYMPVANAFEGMWIDVPVPFKRGDILYNKAALIPARPFILEYTANQPTDDFSQRRINRLSRDWDSKVMRYSACFIDNDGNIYDNTEGCYLDLEYYRDEIPKRYDPLLSISKILNGHIMQINEIERLTFKRSVSHISEDFRKVWK